MNFNTAFKKLSLSQQLDVVYLMATLTGAFLQGSFPKKSLSIGPHAFRVIHGEARSKRRDRDLLIKEGILNEKDPRFATIPHNNPVYCGIIHKRLFKKFKGARLSTIINVGNSSPKAILIPLTLKGKNGKGTVLPTIPNVSPLGNKHFVFFALPERLNGERVLRKQVHHSDTVYWISDFLTQLNDPDYNGFFNPINSGNSEDLLHVQYLKEQFPFFDMISEQNVKDDLTFIDKSHWPFEGWLLRYPANTPHKELYLEKLNKKIEEYINKGNNYNLLFHSTGDYHELYLAYRGENPVKLKVNNTLVNIAGYEVAGNIILEDKELYDNIRELSWYYE
ncbi:hypothetical protein AGMMS50230_08270 [Spirochaetia bacterium]|nr:hypothetical protein AGMMS50230_08270 [Spirochaetia bacterium]